MSSTTSSPSPSPTRHSSPSSPTKVKLAFSDIASLVVKMRRTRERSKSHHIDSDSGEPRTHPELAAQGVTSSEQLDMEVSDEFICQNGVDVVKLLRITRGRLLDNATLYNANVLVNEQWHCTICGPKHRTNGTFKVLVRYSASASRSLRADPKNPVAVDQVRNVPGLMTVLARH